jgi:hypothetical protein
MPNDHVYPTKIESFPLGRAWRPPSLRSAPSLQDFLQMILRPRVEGAQRSRNRLTERGQRIFDAWGDHRIDGPAHQPITRKLAQRLREHLVRDPRNRPPQLPVPLGIVRELIQDQHAPLVADGRQDLVNLADLPEGKCLTNP